MADPETPILSVREPLLLVGGAPVDRALMKRLAVGRSLVAADSGANTALAAGLVPNLVLGDLDSIEDLGVVRQRTRVVHISDQNTTDLEKSLAYVDAPVIIGLGFLGARFDHSLAALHALAACTKPRDILLIGENDAVLRVRGDFVCEFPIGVRISIWPLASQAFRRSSGLRYPLDGLTLSFGSTISTSNETSATRVVIDALDGPGYLVIVPLEVLDAMLTLWPSK